MPSPFPGMDPYLEGAEWIGVHTELALTIARQLAPKLRPKYVVRSARRYILTTWGDEGLESSTIYPDIHIAEAAAPYHLSPVTIPPAPIRLPTVMPEKVPVVTLEIRDTARRTLVTAIELLSPVNKYGDGYEEYLRKRGNILQSSAHLLEIDLLRRGKRVPMRRPLPDAPYFIFLSRVESRPMVEIWPIQLTDPLPIIPVPLLPEDGEIGLDLQGAFTTVYDELGYDLVVDYTRPPQLPLAGDAAAWAANLLQMSGYLAET